MTIDEELIGAGCAAVGAAFAALVSWRYRARVARESARLRDDFNRDREEFSSRMRSEIVTETGAQMAEVEGRFTALAMSMQSTEEALSSGGLNRSGRARALQLLRSGVAPDTAASTLGMAKQEVRLLAKISRILSPRSGN